jgi:hypothetical protein
MQKLVLVFLMFLSVFCAADEVAILGDTGVHGVLAVQAAQGTTATQYFFDQAGKTAGQITADVLPIFGPHMTIRAGNTLLDEGTVQISGGIVLNKNSIQERYLIAGQPVDAASVGGHSGDIVTFEAAQPGATCELAGYVVLKLINGASAKVPYCK